MRISFGNHNVFYKHVCRKQAQQGAKHHADVWIQLEQTFEEEKKGRVLGVIGLDDKRMISPFYWSFRFGNTKIHERGKCFEKIKNNHNFWFVAMSSSEEGIMLNHEKGF